MQPLLITDELIRYSQNTKISAAMSNCNCCSGNSRPRRYVKRNSRKRVQATKQKKAKQTTLQDQFVKTNIDLFLLGIFFAIYNSGSSAEQIFDNVGTTTAESSSSSSSSVQQSLEDSLEYEVSIQYEEEELDNPVYAILFPWFTQTIAIIIYYVLSRYLKVLPYTAIVFLLGTVLGYVTNNREDNAIAHSASIWLGINGQVILLVFLPGLIFHDSFTINVHLFFQGEYCTL